MKRQNKKKLPRIVIPYRMHKEIAKCVGCSERTVNTAAKGIITGPKSIAARTLAEHKLKELNQ